FPGFRGWARFCGLWIFLHGELPYGRGGADGQCAAPRARACFRGVYHHWWNPRKPGALGDGPLRETTWDLKRTARELLLTLPWSRRSHWLVIARTALFKSPTQTRGSRRRTHSLTHPGKNIANGPAQLFSGRPSGLFDAIRSVNRGVLSLLEREPR